MKSRTKENENLIRSNNKSANNNDTIKRRTQKNKKSNEDKKREIKNDNDKGLKPNESLNYNNKDESYYNEFDIFAIRADEVSENEKKST